MYQEVKLVWGVITGLASLSKGARREVGSEGSLKAHVDLCWSLLDRVDRELGKGGMFLLPVCRWL